jgi:hypothetical protein
VGDDWWGRQMLAMSHTQELEDRFHDKTAIH